MCACRFYVLFLTAMDSKPIKPPQARRHRSRGRFPCYGLCSPIAYKCTGTYLLFLPWITFVNSTSYKENVAPRGVLTGLQCTKFVFDCSAPDPAGGAYNAPQNTSRLDRGYPLRSRQPWTPSRSCSRIRRRRCLERTRSLDRLSATLEHRTNFVWRHGM